ncbi:50S ribosomal protein L21 [Candidatus Wolfebacteria bacterium]|nr:MAG: 50S ribosomal protein L21 [Candidatus Wolfebacteria bacterium]
MSFAVIETGGKQYKVSVGDSLRVEKLSGPHKEGDTITFDKVMIVDDGKNTTVGTPYIDKAKVEASFEEEGKAKKISVIQYKSKSRHFINKGHRQPYTKVKITSIK